MDLDAGREQRSLSEQRVQGVFCSPRGLSDALGSTLEFRSSSHHSLKCSVLGEVGSGGPCERSPLPLYTPSRSPHYGSPINTFTVRPGTRHPISYAYSGTHRKSTS